MRYLKECAIILGVTLIGEWLKHLLPLPVPPGVYGLFLLLFLLCCGILKLEQVEATGNFLLDIMSFLFVPAAVGLMDSYPQLEPVLVPFLCICIISTIIVMVITGKTADWILRCRKKAVQRKDGKEL